MTDTTPSFSCRYYLNLEEAKEGFALATFGKKKFTRYVTPLMSIAIIIWGISLGLDGVGRLYVALGSTFLILQMLLRFVVLPKMFARQYVRYRFGETEQGIDLYQDYGVLHAAGRQQEFKYSEVISFMTGQQSYMIELNNKTMIIVSKRAVAESGQQALFESVFAKR